MNLVKKIGIISETVSDQASDSIHDNHTLDLKEVADEQYRNGNKRLSGHKIDVETDGNQTNFLFKFFCN